MKPKNNKMTLVMAIILTIIALPLAVISTYGHVLYPSNNDTLACDLKLTDGSCYTCENKAGYCNYVADSLYALNYYKGTNNFVTVTSGYVFLMDSPTTFNGANLTEHPKTIIYNTTSGNKISIIGLNNYGIGIKGDYYIGITDNGKYTLYYINQTVKKVITEEYDFIGLANHLENGKLDSSKFVALKNNEWLLIDANNKALSTAFTNPIYDYSTKAVALYKDNNYYLSDYAGNNLLNMYFDKVYFYKEKLLSSTIKVNRPEDINVEKSDDYFDISIGGIKNTRVYYDGRIESLNNSNENDNNTNQDAIDDNTNTFDNAS